jgi:hypothetical protein
MKVDVSLVSWGCLDLALFGRGKNWFEEGEGCGDSIGPPTCARNARTVYVTYIPQHVTKTKTRV